MTDDGARMRGDRGAALVEGAFVAVPFFTLIFGVFEFGLLFKAYLTVSNMTSTGARAASAVGDDIDADYQILTAVDRGGAALNRLNLNRIVIFHADGPGDSVPAACLSGTTGSSAAGAECNVYFPNDLGLVAEDFNCKTGPTPGFANDQYWCPDTRTVYPFDHTGTAQTIDHVGIYVEYDYEAVTGLFGDGWTISDTTILRFEPQGRNAP